MTTHTPAITGMFRHAHLDAIEWANWFSELADVSDTEIADALATQRAIEREEEERAQ